MIDFSNGQLGFSFYAFHSIFKAKGYLAPKYLPKLFCDEKYGRTEKRPRGPATVVKVWGIYIPDFGLTHQFLCVSS